MKCNNRRPTCGSKTTMQILTEDEIVAVITKPSIGFDEERARLVAQALIKSGLALKTIL